MFVLWVFLANEARADLIDRVVAVVDDRPLLASEIAIEAEFARIDPGSRLPPPPADPVTWAVDAAIIRALAANVALYEPSGADVRARIEALRDTFVDRVAWRTFLDRRGLDEDRLADVLERQLVVERYLLRNLQADPADEAGWSAALEEYLAPLRTRVKVRLVPASTGP